MIDLNVLSRGDGYELLKESYVIFICTYDEFGKGRHQYTFENLCLEDTEIRLNDGSHKIFLCADGDMDDCSEKMKDFLNYIAGGTESGELSDRLREEVEKSKSKEKWRLDYMTLQEKYREKYDEGRKDEREDGIRIFIEDKVEDGIPDEQIKMKLERKYKLPPKKAGEYLNKYATPKVMS